MQLTLGRIDEINKHTMVVYAKDELGDISTFSLPESSMDGNWGKTTARRSGVPREKRPKASSSTKRKAPVDDQQSEESSHSTPRPKPTKCIKTEQEINVVPETPPRDLGLTSTPVLQQLALRMLQQTWWK